MPFSIKRLACWLVLLVLESTPAHAAEVIHVFVALCDNASQGIVPVPTKIGDGDKRLPTCACAAHATLAHE